MRTKIIRNLAGLLLFVVLFVPSKAQSQTSQNSVAAKVDQSSSSKAALEAAIRKELEEINAASARYDVASVMAHIADDEGMYYDPETGRVDVKRYKDQWREAVEDSAKHKETVSDEITNLYVLQLAPDTALANYVDINKTTLNGKTTVIRIGETDIFVLRSGRWLIRSSHGERLRNEVEPVISGLPTDWERLKNSNADDYVATVDTSVHHGGNASVSLKFGCGSEAVPWVGLRQEIDAFRFKGKRMRLSGWIKTADAGEAAIWLRADSEHHMLAFDNMSERSVKGSTDWKRYEIVLDIPEESVNLVFGPLLVGKGQAWFDDLALEVVGQETPVTAKISDAERNLDRESLTNLKRSSRTAPINLGFENGSVK